MKTLLISAALLGASSIAMAQNAPSTVDQPGVSGHSKTTDPKQSSPGATGAMNNAASGVATSPQDVQKQSNPTGAAGKGTTSPGTVGASPGDDPAKPKPKN